MATEKMTKTMWFEELRNVVEESDAENKEDLINFVDTQIESLAARAARAKERAAAKRVEGNDLKNAIKAVLTDQPQSIDEIMSQIDLEDVTRAKVVARLTQMVHDGEVTKKNLKPTPNHRVMAYLLS